MPPFVYSNMKYHLKIEKILKKKKKRERKKKRRYLANITPLTWRVNLTNNFNYTIMREEEIYYIPHKV